MVAQPIKSFKFSLLAASLSGVLLTSSIHANANDQVYSLSLPASSLDQAISELGEQTGISISINSTLSENLKSHQISGTLSVEQAIAQLLAGTNLKYSKTDTGYVINDNGVSDPVAQLPDMHVKAVETIEVLGQPIERSSSPTGLDLSVKETPQSISVLDANFIEYYGLDDIEDVLNNSAGVYRYKYGTSDDTLFSSRGFYVNEYVKDGMPAGFSRGQEFRLDSAVYDSVEVLRGAAGLMAGAGEPSATVNLISKKPTRERLLNVSAELGSFNHKRAELDASSALTEDGKYAARVVLVFEDSDTYVDREDIQKQVIYTQFHGYFGAQEQTEAALTLHHQKLDHNGVHWGVPIFNTDGSRTDLPKSTNLASPNAFQNREHTGYTFKLSHQLNLDWQLNGAIYHGTNDLDSIFTYFAFAPDPQTGKGLFGIDSLFADEGEVTTITASAIGRIELLGREHQINITYLNNETEYTNVTYEKETPEGRRAFHPIDSIFNENPARGINAPNMNQKIMDRMEAVDEETLALSTNIDVHDQVNVIAGIKFYKFKQHNKNYTSWQGHSASSSSDDGDSKYLGLVYSPTDTLNIYASYTDTYKPQPGLVDINLDPIEAITGQNIELGLKLALFDDKFNINIAAFDTLLKNVAEAIPEYANSNPIRYRQVDGANSTGFELEIAGDITENWQLNASYSEFSLEDQQGEDVNKEAPRKLLKLNTSYQYNDWRAGIGLQWNDDTTVNVLAPRGVDLGIPAGTRRGSLADTKQGETLISAHLGYQVTEQLDVKVHVRNLLDESYYDTYGFVPKKAGSPRTWVINANYKF
ncbi:TonB-dependent siderophore receptor [Pseudoalteromonas luteoviolacea]|uniref:Secretin/TonB short N-terminal domain-containing protein n=1 Tax=Pseudoalteromonas luteoviolacea S4054 TaxID=1129367 RepID=A0A0F6A8U6_9GAMM|nr:TonB-dependent receptor [Pseudoalteromonas luteoviolacea]AOT07062.1 hypothetical protein S4054249_03875 [Pseudoalteromonas luteoviolacea]AOT11980.1 hypothetical protein S40542_03875 [Pseudoalteromonas luteoviolacea]AOT16892.1 hypothetical protein S4054_03875 [Pseudoalteromonas luteoviolacea]KKE82610.1 hypothetical protein N479_17520 [Pseudoalteromonas luteoviolacea S4054]KZN69956.1 hypothetical protein N481_21305 [Pseudoalteromonas luteoviolacea S4047-1]